MTLSTVTLKDPSGSEAEIVVGLGCNCIRFSAPIGDKTAEAFWCEEGFTDGDKRPSRSGNPVLFPYPGRLKGTEFTWGGKTYTQPAGDSLGNAIHGFVHTRPWRIESQTDQQLVAEFQASVDDPKIEWPSDFHLSLRYTLEGNCLKLDACATNAGSESLPCALGFHPYFKMPPVAGSEDNSQSTLHFSASRIWELVDMLPSGQRLPFEEQGAYAVGKPFAETELDNIFSGLADPVDGWHEVKVADKSAGVQTRMRFDESFEYLVVFTAPTRQSVCLEPLTCAPTALSQDPATAKEWGVKALPPGGTMECQVEFWLEAAE